MAKLKLTAMLVIGALVFQSGLLFGDAADGQDDSMERTVDPASMDARERQSLMRQIQNYVRRYDEDTAKEVMAFFEELPEGYTLRNTYNLGVAWDSNPGMRKHLAVVATMNTDGEVDGYEIHLRPTPKLVRFNNGIRHGIEEIHGQDTRQLIPWVNGVIHGERIGYSDGKLHSHTVFEEGKPTGVARFFTPDGDVQETISYKDGEMHGERVQYWPENTEIVRRRIPYKMGNVHGVARDYNNDGKITRELPFRNGILHGIERHFDGEGSLTRTRFWLDGDMVPQGRFDREYKQEQD